MVQELTRYAKNLMNKHYHFEYRRNLEGMKRGDLVSEAYSQGFENFEEAKKIIRRYFFDEVYKIKGRRQYSDISAEYEKVCNGCKELKHQSEFGHVFDKRYNIHYLYFICLGCENIKQREYRKNKPLTEEQKEKAKIRYIRWKKKHKKYEYAV